MQADHEPPPLSLQPAGGAAELPEAETKGLVIVWISSCVSEFPKVSRPKRLSASESPDERSSSDRPPSEDSRRVWGSPGRRDVSATV